MKKICSVVLIVLITTLIVVMAVSFTGCDNKKLDLSQEYDSNSDYGLYFYGNDHSLETVDMKRASTSLSSSYFDSSKPTIIWCHGWELTYAECDNVLSRHTDTTTTKDTQEDISYPAEYKKLGYNVATFQFQGEENNYASTLANIFKYTWVNFNDTGKSMAYYFAAELCTIMGEDYNQEITYVGHSCGSFVTVAVNYYVDAFLSNGLISNSHLVASKMLLADPYINDLKDGIQGKTIYYTNEAVGENTKLDIVANSIENLHTKYNTATAIYLGMGVASDSMKSYDQTKYDALSDASIIVDMTGLRTKFGSFNIHCLTRDWVLTSIISEKLKDQNDALAPSGACSAAELLTMIGKEYTQNNQKFDLSSESLTLVDTVHS